MNEQPRIQPAEYETEYYDTYMAYAEAGDGAARRAGEFAAHYALWTAKEPVGTEQQDGPDQPVTNAEGLEPAGR